MPLSEHEQRILRQIEQQLERDPSFAHQRYRLPRRRVAMFSLLTLLGIAATVLALGVSVWLSVACFVGTVAAAAMLEREARLVARERVGALPVSVWLGGRRRQRPGPPSGSRRAPIDDRDA